MINPLDPSLLEDGIAAYIAAAADYLALTVPNADPDATAGVPAIVKGLDKQDVDAHTITLAITAPELNQEAVGFYQPEVHIWVITPATHEQNTRAHHQAVVAALGSCFPNRPSPGSADLAAWQVIEAAFSAAVTASAPGWEVNGWYCKTGAYAKDDERWEQRITLTLGIGRVD